MARQQRTVSLVKIEDEDLPRHEVLAYSDGYADARTFGEDGFFIPTHYNRAAREQYRRGFAKGLRVYRVLERMTA